jgi:hypothetical protein
VPAIAFRVPASSEIATVPVPMAISVASGVRVYLRIANTQLPLLNDPYSRTSAIMTNPKAKQSNKRLTDRKPPTTA